MATKPLAVVLEVGATKVFASALDWPGWCRSGRTEDAAIETLISYAQRYADVARHAKIPFRPPGAVDVVERLQGDAGTDFGIPSVTARAETRRLTAAPARRLAALVAAAWAVLDEIAAVTPEELRKGPRGGGRDRAKMLDHVLGAEVGYARKIGVKLSQPTWDDTVAVEELREAILAVIGSPTEAGPTVAKGWTTAYAARRVAWHVLDHAWEMQDRTEAPPGT